MTHQVTTLKPGTRCECRSLDCETSAPRHREDHEQYGIKGGSGFCRCTDDADTLVSTGSNPIKDIPFCAPCADWHERGSK